MKQTDTDLGQLPHLLKLLDDPSETVRRGVVEALQSFGPGLKEQLNNLPAPPVPYQRELLQRLLTDRSREILLADWPSWREADGDKKRLEEGLSRISEFMHGWLYPLRVGELLDSLAAEFRESGRDGPLPLAEFLFGEKGFRGARDPYNLPEHSSLLYVLYELEGLPISLAAIYLLVARRLDLPVEGCNFPGHFLARAETDEGFRWIDCFEGGAVLREEELVRKFPGDADNVRRILKTPADAETITARSLRNLVKAYEEADDAENRDLMNELLRRMDQDGRETETENEGEISPEPKFRPGQLVKHRRYGYRGVVVDYDLTCRADESWYRSNRTQPERNQPWYHVLVHESNAVTYSAQTSLQPDESGERIVHPLISYFFSRFDSGLYERNDQPWPHPNG